MAASASGDAMLAHDLRVAVLRVARRIRAARVDTTLSLSQLSALAVLDTYGPMTAGDLAAAESVQPPTMTKVLAALVERGLISRAPHPDDKRAVQLAVTGIGHAAVDAERQARDAWLAGELRELNERDRALLTQLVPLLEAIGAASPPDVSTITGAR